jgi:uncharacterized protein (DUF58 family)
MASAVILKQYHRVFRYSQWVRRHFTFAGHLFLIILLMSGAFGVDTSATTSYQLFVFLLVLFIFAFVSSHFVHLKISAKRQLPRYFTVGEESTYSITLNNLSGCTYQNLVLFEQLQESLPSVDELEKWYQVSCKKSYIRNVSFRQWRSYLIHKQGGVISGIETPDLPAKKYNKTVQLNVTFTPLRRGKLNYNGFKIAHPDLLGLFRKMLVIHEKQTCLVLPQRYSIAPLLLAGSRKYQAGGISLANSVGDSSEFMSLREYRNGDPLNSIHWKSFARHGKLIVKEYQDEYFVRRALLLDTFTDTLTDKNANDYFEAAISIAASVCMSERQNEALLDLMFIGEETHRFTSGRGVDHLPHIQEVLASVQISSGKFNQLKKAIINHVHNCSSIVCVFMAWDKERQELIHILQSHSIPVAVFLVHDGSITADSITNRPEHFHLIDHHTIGADLGAI